MIDLVHILEWTGTVAGVFGAALVASNTKYSAFGWISFLISSTCIAGYAFLSQAHGLLVLECTFILTNLLGLWRWLLSPYIVRNRQQK